MRTTALGACALAVMVAGCGAQQAGHPTAHHAARDTVGPAASTASRVVTLAAANTPSRCVRSNLSVRLGRAGHAAGSTYRPIVFTNTGSSNCTLRGYPGVAYVAPTSGRQVGAAASRDSAEPLRTVTLAPGGHASALLQLVNYLNYPPSDCAAKTVSGIRVYPPGSTTATFVAFAHHRKACSSNVHQLSVRRVLRGTTGQ